MKGWIKLHRELKGHWIWNTKEPYSKREAWIDLLWHANYTDNKVNLNNAVIEIKRGQQARSELTLATEWKWSRGKVRRFLKRLQDEQMIVQHTTHLTSIISICNYERFQGEDSEDSTSNGTTDSTTVSTTNGHPTVQRSVHSKESQEGKESKKRKSPSAKFTEADMTCAEYILKGVKRLDPDKQPNMKSWANTCRLMREIDKRAPKEICEVFKFANNNVRFWQRNVLSPDSLRKNFMSIKLEMEGNSKPASSKHHFEDNEYGTGGHI